MATKEVGTFLPCSSTAKGRANTDIEELAKGVDEGVEEFNKTEFKMGKTTTFYLKGTDGSTDLEKKLAVSLTEHNKAKSANAAPRNIPCNTKIERLDDSTWAVHVTPLKGGDLKLNLGLKNASGTVVDHIVGYPQDIRVKKLPKFHLQTPKDIFTSPKFVAALKCEDEEFEPESMVVVAKAENGRSIPVVVNG